MIVKFSLLILALALLAVTSTVQENYRPAKKNLSWGDNANGLRMAVWENTANDKVYAVVRNFSSKKVCYCEPELSNFTIYARNNSSSQWRELGLKSSETVVILPVCQMVTLMPNEEMRSFATYKTSQNQNYSFFVDLREYSFPVELSGTVEMRIVQYNVYCNKTKNTTGEVESQIFKIKLPLTDATTQN